MRDQSLLFHLVDEDKSDSSRTKTMKLGIPHATSLLPLRAFGMEPGRALANARPTPEQLQTRRIEQFKYIVAQCRDAERLDDVDRATVRAVRHR